MTPEEKEELAQATAQKVLSEIASVALSVLVGWWLYTTIGAAGILGGLVACWIAWKLRRPLGRYVLVPTLYALGAGLIGAILGWLLYALSGFSKPEKIWAVAAGLASIGFLGGLFPSKRKAPVSAVRTAPVPTVSQEELDKAIDEAHRRSEHLVKRPRPPSHDPAVVETHDTADSEPTKITPPLMPRPRRK